MYLEGQKNSTKNLSQDKIYDKPKQDNSYKKPRLRKIYEKPKLG
jgi:hypothetical protein